MCEIVKAGRSFDDRKYRDTFTRLPPVTLSKEHIRRTFSSFLKKKNHEWSFGTQSCQRSDGLSHDEWSFYVSTISDNATLEACTLSSRIFPGGKRPWRQLFCICFPRAETQVKELEGEWLDGNTKTDILSSILNFLRRLGTEFIDWSLRLS